MKIIKTNEVGVTLVELMISLGLGLGLLLLAVTAFNGLNQLQYQNKLRIIENKQINNMLQNIRKGLAYYQIHYDNSVMGDAQGSLKKDNLKYAWDSHIVTEKKNCEKCSGRMGFVISPHQNMKGLYVVKFRLTHKDWGENVIKEYSYAMTLGM